MSALMRKVKENVVRGMVKAGMPLAPVDATVLLETIDALRAEIERMEQDAEAARIAIENLAHELGRG